MSGIALERLLISAADGQSIIVSDGTNNLTIDGSGYITANINGSVTVTATDLDIRDLTSVTDSVEIKTAAGQALSIDASGYVTANINGTVTVTATDLDIRDLVNTQDSIAIGDETNLVDMQQYDAAFGTSSWGFPIFGIRQDASGSPVSATGDAHPLVFNDDGELKVAADLTSSVADDSADSGNPIKVGGRALDQASAWGAVAANDRVDNATDLYRRQLINDAPNISASATAATVTNTEVLLGTAIAGRLRILIQNNGSLPIFVGQTGVTTATGLEVSKGSTLSLELGESIDLYGIAASGSQDVRILQLA